MSDQDLSGGIETIARWLLLMTPIVVVIVVHGVCWLLDGAENRRYSSRHCQ